MSDHKLRDALHCQSVNQGKGLKTYTLKLLSELISIT
jgi:hypothetical protein